jgi:uroporphyrinogen decarboxylase
LNIEKTGENLMNSRERVLRAFDHKETDRVPVDFGGTVVTCMDLHAHKALKSYLNIHDSNDPIIDYTMGTVEPCEKIKQLLKVDFRRVGLNVIPPEIKNGMYSDGFGIVLKKAEPHEYYDVISNPIEGWTKEELWKMKLPDPDNSALYFGLRDKAKDLYENSPYAIVADFGVPGFYETSQKLRGYENLACDLMIDREFVHELYSILFEFQKRFFRKYLETVGKYVHLIGYADDLGMQDRPQMSPETYREVIKPWHKKIFDYIHEISDVKILLHCCGSVYPLIEDLIETGVDILNPIQVRAAGMNPEKLKKSFGDRLIFWGGIDEQYLLPKGTKDEIIEEVKKMIVTMGKNGGYILAPGHNIQADTPAQNILAMFEIK